MIGECRKDTRSNTCGAGVGAVGVSVLLEVVVVVVVLLLLVLVSVCYWKWWWWWWWWRRLRWWRFHEDMSSPRPPPGWTGAAHRRFARTSVSVLADRAGSSAVRGSHRQAEQQRVRARGDRRPAWADLARRLQSDSWVPGRRPAIAVAGVRHAPARRRKAWRAPLGKAGVCACCCCSCVCA